MLKLPPCQDMNMITKAGEGRPPEKTTLRGNFSHVVRPPPPPQYGNAHVKNTVFFPEEIFF